MDDGTKCCLGIIVIFVIAALFLLWPQPKDPLKTEIDITGYHADENGTGYIEIDCRYYENETKTDYLENASVEVNITYENNTTVKYTLVSDYFGDVKIENLEPGEYTVSARILGDDTYAPSAKSDTVEVGEYIAPASTDYDTGYSTDSNYQTYTTTRYYWVYV
ncbi:carboxypeptidase-like regulatory domain-containing protein [Methanobrevibacter sp.]|uniref:carboxypeptidase-like regulatory domain-containing protein n=1 Tax=Methanobrevibacter sp. TaxID=66852 RepID=UPI00388FAA94